MFHFRGGVVFITEKGTEKEEGEPFWFPVSVEKSKKWYDNNKAMQRPTDSFFQAITATRGFFATKEQAVNGQLPIDKDFKGACFIVVVNLSKHVCFNTKYMDIVHL